MNAARAIDVADLGAALERELAAATDRLDRLRARREQAERELEAAAAAEQQAREALDALRSIASRAGLDLDRDDGTDAQTGDAGLPGLVRLAGGDLRQMLTRVALRRNAHGQPVHWSTWFEWLHGAGFEAAGKRAEAVFQTQLARSPLVRRTDQEGVYILDVELLNTRRGEVVELTRRLAELPPPDQLALIGDVRTERRETQQRLARAERALEEAWRTLAEEVGEEPTIGPQQLLERWRHRGSGRESSAGEPR